MDTNIIGVVIAIISGFLVAVINYIISKTVLEKAPKKYSLITVVRQVLQIGFLVAVYFIGTKTQEADVIPLLVGAAFGMTVPMIYFTKKLLSINQASDNKRKENDVNG